MSRPSQQKKEEHDEEQLGQTEHPFSWAGLNFIRFALVPIQVLQQPKDRPFQVVFKIMPSMEIVHGNIVVGNSNRTSYELL